MSICSGAVDGLLDEQELVCFWSFSVWRTSKLEVLIDFLWDGMAGELHGADIEGHFLKCQIKVAVTKSKTLILHESMNEEGFIEAGRLCPTVGIQLQKSDKLTLVLDWCNKVCCCEINFYFETVFFLYLTIIKTCLHVRSLCYWLHSTKLIFYLGSTWVV